MKKTTYFHDPYELHAELLSTLCGFHMVAWEKYFLSSDEFVPEYRPFFESLVKFFTDNVPIKDPEQIFETCQKNSGVNIDYTIKYNPLPYLINEFRLLNRQNEIHKLSENMGSLFPKELDDAILEIASKPIFSETRPGIDPLEYEAEYRANLQRRREHKDGLFTGRPLFDSMVSMERGQLITIAARPSVGKSALALNIAHECSMMGAKVGYFSLEMSQAELMDRLMARITGVHASRFKYGNVPEEVLARGFHELKQAMGKIRFEIPNGKTIAEIIRQADFIHAKDGLDLLIIDHIDLIQDSGNRNETEATAIARITANLKKWAMAKNGVVIALSQFNRESRGEMPQMHQLRGSGAKEQDSDCVLILHRDLDPDTVGFTDAQLRIAKNRTGQLGDIKLKFMPELTFFKEI